jgi:hypothetical protein
MSIYINLDGCIVTGMVRCAPSRDPVIAHSLPMRGYELVEHSAVVVLCIYRRVPGSSPGHWKIFFET